ncbi:MAG: hypothetical protein HYV09_32260 [Deltaproteobacteria bacterium]|nr:hypothetical protein [Deltaproteobacteria bacterium]
MRWSRTAPIALAAVVLHACGIVPPTREGELGRGTFEYVCTNATDSACDDFGGGTFPGAIAVGASFGLRAQSGQVMTAAPAVSGSSGTFRASKPGTFAFYLMNGDEIVDYIHIKFRKATALTASRSEIIAYLSSDSYSWDDRSSFRVVLDDYLGGSFAPQVDIEPAELATWSLDRGVISVDGLQEGSGKVVVRALGLSLSIPLEVRASRWPDAGLDSGGDTDGGLGDGADGDGVGDGAAEGAIDAAAEALLDVTEDVAADEGD